MSGHRGDRVCYCWGGVFAGGLGASADPVAAPAYAWWYRRGHTPDRELPRRPYPAVVRAASLRAELSRTKGDPNLCRPRPG